MSELLLTLLGSVELGLADGPTAPVAQPMQRVLLGMLGLADGQIVTSEVLADGLWGADRPLEWKRQNLHGQVSTLRRRLEIVEPGRGGARLERSGGGYRLTLDPGRLDVGLFRALVAKGREAVREGATEVAADLLAEALDLWRGPALADAAPYCPRLAGEAARLEEMRLAVLEDLLNAELRLGRHGEIAAEITSLASDYPFRERMAGLAMVALWRCGRRGEALGVFDRARRLLAEELGLDPGPELRALHARVLADDPALEAPGVIYDSAADHIRVDGPGSTPAGVTRTARGNIPEPRTSFVGRRAELAQLAKLADRHRLLTITGSGGAGKTRLALEVATARALHLRDGCRFVDLSELSDPAGVGAAIAEAIGIRHAPDRAIDNVLLEQVAGMRALLVIDNCEHLIDSVAATVEQILEAGPGVRVIATSRQVLGLPGESVWQTPPISFPSGPENREAVDLASFDAVKLFVERAAHLTGPDLSPDDLRRIAEITASVEGLPLAIELAAARAAQLDLSQLATALADRLGLSLLRSRTRHVRQQTLDAAIGWSYDLLGPELRSALKRLSVFSGGFTLEAAGAVLGGEGDSIDMVVALAERSLIVGDRVVGPDRSAGATLRYRMLESIRHYCATKITEEDGAGWEEPVRDAHSRYFADLARQASVELTSWNQGRWLTTLEAEHANLIAALNHLLGRPGGVEEALRMIVHLDRFWHNRGHLIECASLLRRCLALGGDTVTGALRSSVLTLAGHTELKGDMNLARSYFGEALEIARNIGDDHRVAYAVWVLSWVAASSGDWESATRYRLEALDIARTVGDQVLLGEILSGPSAAGGSPAETLALCEEALAVTRRSGDRIYAALAHNNFGNLLLEKGDLAAALRNFEQAQEIMIEVGAPTPWPTLNTGWVHLQRGDPHAARTALVTALQMPEVRHLRRETSYLVLALACCATAVSDWPRAATLLGFADAELQGCGLAWEEPEATYHADALLIVRRSLGALFDTYSDVASRVDRGNLIEYALGHVPWFGP